MNLRNVKSASVMPPSMGAHSIPVPAPISAPRVGKVARVADLAPLAVPEMTYVFLPMAEVPQRWRPRLRKLSMGPVEGAMVRWSYHDGSTWTMVGFRGHRREPSAIVGWAVFTLQEARHPIVGVYVSEKERGHGYGTELVSRLLRECAHLVPYGKIYAVADWWPKYVELIEAAGFEHFEWD